MEFVTIHDLSRELDVSARVVRYHLTRLVASGKLKKEEDYRQEDFRDPLHFEWKINPLAFMRESGLRAKQPLEKISLPTENDSITLVSKTGNEPITESTRGVDEPIKPPPHVNQAVDHSLAIITLHREMIDTLKEQVHVKDTQIRDLSKQNQDASELNLKLNSALLQQGGEIKKLMQLTGGKMDRANVVSEDLTAANERGNENNPAVNNPVSEQENRSELIQTSMAA